VLTSSLEDHIITQSLQAGEDGYWLKTSRPADMMQVIHQVT
jgi:DNA-binding NarL/FixJ family response regulator